MRLKRAAAIVGTGSTALVAAGAAIAIASSGPVNLSTTGVSFSGSYNFYPAGTNHGGMGYPGSICDTAQDGNSTFVQAKVEGYGYGGRVYDKNGNGTCVSENNYSYDPAATYVTTGQIQACQDRGTIASDLCKATGILRR